MCLFIPEVAEGGWVCVCVAGWLKEDGCVCCWVALLTV